MNIIPAIDLRDGQCVRLFQGDFDRQTNYAQKPVELAHAYEKTGFDTLHIVDLNGAQSGQQQNQEIIRKIGETSKMTVQLGGGIRTSTQIESWFDCGIARVVIGSLVIAEPARVQEWLAAYGPERVVLALDVNLSPTGVPWLATHGWRQAEDMTLWQCLDELAPAGVRHVLCTDISRDGAMTGPNLGLYKEFVHRYPDILLQASGGVRDIGDLGTLRQIGAHSAISGRALLEGKVTAEEITTFLHAA